MSKKYRGKPCAYCGGGAATGADHIFAREFFLIEDRRDLPKVPACDACNGRKSRLEHYALSLLPFGGRHASASENLETMVPKRLERNAALHRAIVEGQGRVWLKDVSGAAAPMMTLSLDSEKLNELFGFMAKGLLFYHWQTHLRAGDSVRAMALTNDGRTFFEQRLLRGAVRDRVVGRPGNGTVAYEGAQGVDSPSVSVWLIELFGGVGFADPSASRAVAAVVGVVTGPSQALGEIDG